MSAYSTLNRGRPMRQRSVKREKQDREYRPIHDAVIERDGGCVAGGSVMWKPVAPEMWPWWPEVRCGGSLIVHHVISRARDKTLALEPSNLVCLCERHHQAVHENPLLATERGLLASAPLEEPPK